MEFRHVGTSGLRVSAVGLGCNNFGWQIDEQQSMAVIHAALDVGVTLFDTADVYGNKGLSEEYLGRALGPRRKDIVLATKFGITMGDGQPAGASRSYILDAVERSLKRLGTDWIDLYQIHRPDLNTPIEETLRALDDLVRSGKVRYIGLSDFPAWLVVEAQWTGKQSHFSPLISAQYEYSLLARTAETEVLPALRSQGIGLLPYFPLASGLLTGKYRRDQAVSGRLSRDFASQFLTDANWHKIEKLESFAAERGVSLLDIAFGWLLAQSPVASVIAGATRADQIASNIAAARWAADPADLLTLAAITASEPNASGV